MWILFTVWDGSRPSPRLQAHARLPPNQQPTNQPTKPCLLSSPRHTYWLYLLACSFAHRSVQPDTPYSLILPLQATYITRPKWCCCEREVEEEVINKICVIIFLAVVGYYREQLVCVFVDMRSWGLLFWKESEPGRRFNTSFKLYLARRSGVNFIPLTVHISSVTKQQ